MDKKLQFDYSGNKSRVIRMRTHTRMKADTDVRTKVEMRATMREKIKAEHNEIIKAEHNEIIKANAEARMKADADVRTKVEMRATMREKIKAEHNEIIKANAEARMKANAEAKLKADAEAKLKADAEAKLKADAEAKLKSDAEAETKYMQIYISEHLRNSYENDLMTTETIGHYKFVKLKDYNKPCLFYGLWSKSDLHTLTLMKSVAFIVWTGGDINTKNRNQPYIKTLIEQNVNKIKQLNNVYHVAITDTIASSLKEFELPYKTCNFMGISFNNYKPTLKGDYIYVYVGDGSEYYGKSTYLKVYNILKDQYKFIFACSYKDVTIRNHLIPELVNIPILYSDKKDIVDIYKKCFICLRFTMHDGLSATVQELGCMGIKTINNIISSPSIINYSDIASIIQIIDNEYKMINTIDYTLSNKVKAFLSCGRVLLDSVLKTHENIDILFVLNNCIEPDINGVSYMIRQANLLRDHCNIDYVLFKDLDKTNMGKYKYILLDSLTLYPTLNLHTHTEIIDKARTYFNNKIVILLAHDLHWWSFDNAVCSQPIFHNYISNIKDVCFDKNEHFDKNVTLLKELDITYFISLYNNQELKNYINDCTFIKKFFINYYSYQTGIYHIPNVVPKYDITLYGSIYEAIYNLRHKLYNFIKYKNNEKLKVIDIDYYGHNKQYINQTINESWLSVATLSRFNYLVRKYFEIPSTKSVLLCNANIDVLKIIGNNFIYVHEHMNYQIINNIIEYYINNKSILCYLSFNAYNTVINKNAPLDYTERLNKIIRSIKTDDINEYEYNIFNANNKIHFINYYYKQQQINTYEKDCVVKIHKNHIYLYEDLESYREDINGFIYCVLDKPCLFFDKILNHSVIYAIKKYKFIDQIFISPSLEYFKEYLLNENNLFEYRCVNIPSFFYGIWLDTYETIRNHNDIRVLIFTGGDLTITLKNIDMMELLSHKNTYIIGISTSICKTLTHHNIRHVYFPYYKEELNIEYKFNNKTRNKILYYTSFNPNTYNLDLILLLEELLPQYEFIFTSNISHINVANKNKNNLLKLFGETKYNFIKNKIIIYSNEELLEQMDECFIYLRPCELDGLSQLSLECAMKGIKTLSNAIGTSCCIEFDNNNIENIITLINEEYYMQNNDTTHNYQQKIISNINDELKHPPILYTEVFFKYNINYYFDKIYVLNLKKDINKRNQITKLFDKFNINNYKFYEAIYGKENNELLDKYERYSKIPFTQREQKLDRKLIGSVGVLANLISVKNVIIDAKKNNYKRILFMEDDVIFHKNINTLFTDTVSVIENDWKILYMGCQNIINGKTVTMNNTYNAHPDTSGGWCFGIDCSVYDEIITQCNKEELPFDSGPLYYLRKKYPKQCKVIYPNLCICDIGTSELRVSSRTLTSEAERLHWNLTDYDNIAGI
jgi:hypothetical protein